MPIFALSGLINTITAGTLAVFVYFKNRKNSINKKYALFCLFVTVWSFFYFFWQTSILKEYALLWCRLLMASAIFIPVSFLDFVFILLHEKKSKGEKKFITFSYVLYSIFLILDFTPFFVMNVVPKSSFKFWPVPGMAFMPFLAFWIIYCIYPIYIMLVKYKNFTGLKREQIKYIAIGMTFGYLGGATNYFLWFNIPFMPYGNFLISVCVGFMTYSILKYRLMDINIAMTRAGIFVFVYALVLGIPFGLAGWGREWLMSIWGQNWFWAPMIILLGLATVGPFIYQYLRKQAEAIMLKEQKRYQQAIANLIKEITEIRDLDKLLDEEASSITKEVKASFCAMYLNSEEYKSFRLKSAYPPEAKSRFPEFIPYGDSLIACLNAQDKPLLSEEAGKHGKFLLDPGGLVWLSPVSAKTGC